MIRPKFLLSAMLYVGLSISYGLAQMAEQPAAQFDLPAQYAAVAFPQSGPGTRTFALTIYVNQVTSEGDVEEMASLLKNKGQDALVSKLEGLDDKGRVAPAASVGTGVRIVRVRPTHDGGQHIVMITNRPIAFVELRNGLRTRDYPFGIVVLDVSKDGKGSGTFAPACKLKFNKKEQLEVEHYGQKPYRLENVYRTK